MPWFAQGRDAANGILSIRNEPLFLDWDVQQSAATIDAIVRTHEQLARSTGGAAIVPFTWTLSHDLITPHPLGGANMGRTAADGVVNHAGEVFGYRNLYVADGAIVPEALGLNPSKTIAALAERIAVGLVPRRRRRRPAGSSAGPSCRSRRKPNRRPARRKPRKRGRPGDGDLARNEVAAVLILLAIPAAGLRQGAALSTDERAMTSFIDAHNAEGLALLERIVNINSGTQNFEGVRQVGVHARGSTRSGSRPSGSTAPRGIARAIWWRRTPARHRRFC